MARNIEIKARLPAGGIAESLPRALALPGARGPTEIAQDDSFFHARDGRLKLRRFGDGSAELIHYRRGDSPEARASDYVRVELPDARSADALHLALERGLGLLGRVVKQRTLVLVDATRIHFDRVQDLPGEYLELEVVMQDGRDEAEGRAEAEALMAALGLKDAERIAGAYLDLLAAGRPG
jgi:adenylate cyclase class IV